MRIKVLFLSVIILTFSQSIYPQMNFRFKYTNGPMGGCIGDFAINSKGHIYAGSYSNAFTFQNITGLFKSTDNGETWKKIKCQFPDFDTYAVFINKNDDIFVGTNYQNVIYRSTDNGESWKSSNTGYPTGECWAIGSNKDGSVLFAGDGFYNGFARSTNNGNSWQALTQMRVTCFAVDSNNIIYCGTLNGIIKSSDNGNTWSNLPLNYRISSIQIDKNNYVYCGTGYTSGGNGVFKSTDKGSTWTSLGLHGKIVYSLAIRGDSLFAGTSNEGIYISSNLGTTWLHLENGITNMEVFRLKFNHSNDLFISSDITDGIFKSTDMGLSFTQIGLPVSAVNNIAFMDDSLLIASTLSGVQKYNRLTKKWTNIGLENIAAVSILHNRIYALTKKGDLYFSEDFGKDWEKILIVSYPYNMMALDSVIFVCAGYNKIYSSWDKGKTWSSKSVKFYNQTDYSIFYVPEKKDVWFTSTNMIYKTSDWGRSYDSISTPLEETYCNSMYIKNNNIFLTGNNTAVELKMSSDYGKTWRNNLQYPVKAVTGIGDDIFISCYRKILFTYNYGRSFQEIITADSLNEINDIKLASNGKMYIASTSQGVYEVDYIVVVNDKEPYNNDYYIDPLYPNPFNNSTMLSYRMDSDAFVKVNVFNILGQKVKELYDYKSKGTIKQEISFEGLNAGVYFVRVEIGDKYNTLKAVYLK